MAELRARKPNCTMLDYLEVVKKIGETIIPRNEAMGDKTTITDELRQLVYERDRQLLRGSLEKSHSNRQHDKEAEKT